MYYLKRKRETQLLNKVTFHCCFVLLFIVVEAKGKGKQFNFNGNVTCIYLLPENQYRMH